MAFVKLDCGILTSTLWIDKDARILFITALLMAEPYELTEPMEQINVRDLNGTGFMIPTGWYGLVDAAGIGIISRSGLDVEVGLCALERLGQEDPESRTASFGGRRMCRINGGYIILNYDKYRSKDHTAAARSKKYRDSKKQSHVTVLTSPVTSRSVTQAYAYADADAKADVDTATGKDICTPVIPKSLMELQAEQIYEIYPRKVGRPTAIKSIYRALGKVEFPKLFSIVQQYSKAVSKKEMIYIPYPATWFNQERYNDSPDTWNPVTKPKRNGPNIN